jgi:hypothetical protein
MMRLFRDAEAIEETTALSDALTFSLDELRYEYPDEQVEGFSNAQDALMQRSPTRAPPAVIRKGFPTRCAPISGMNSN